LAAEATATYWVVLSEQADLSGASQIADWNARERHLELLEARLKYLEMKRQFAENPPRLVSFDEIEESVQARK